MNIPQEVLDNIGRLPPDEKEFDAYKVTSLAVTSINNSIYNINYNTKGWVFPSLKGSRLFVFRYFEDACDFLKNRCFEGHIFKCKVRGLVSIKEVCTLNNALPDFWRGYLTSTMLAPRGSYTTSAIKLSNRIATYKNGRLDIE